MGSRLRVIQNQNVTFPVLGGVTRHRGLLVGYSGMTRGRCSGEKTCFGLAAIRWISSELLMVEPGSVVDRAMWVAAGVVLGGSRLLAVEVRYGGAGCDDRGRRYYVNREWC